ncbi:MAG: hypothetical protein LC664_03020, partial [Flavobacteriales bacterium]|nr:hypothetical protein [Flavobacteriales bacterium]
NGSLQSIFATKTDSGLLIISNIVVLGEMGWGEWTDQSWPGNQKAAVVGLCVFSVKLAALKSVDKI